MYKFQYFRIRDFLIVSLWITLCLKLFVESRVDVNVTDNKDYSTLYYSMITSKFPITHPGYYITKTDNKCLDTVQVLLYYGAKVNLMGCSTCCLLFL